MEIKDSYLLGCFAVFSLIAMMEKVSTSETSINFYQTKRRNIQSSY
jgi:hypothetical protein